MRKVLAVGALTLALAGCNPQGERPQTTQPTPPPQATAAVTNYQPPPMPSPDPAFDAPGPGWVLGGVSDNSVSWIHMSSVSRSGSTARVWILSDSLRGRSVGTLGARSLRALQEYDCRGRRTRNISLIHFALNKGAGSIVRTWPESWNEPWDSIAPDTVGETHLRIACQP